MQYDELTPDVFETLLERAATKERIVSVELVVKPEMAARLLREHNTDNFRNYSPTTVGDYASDMTGERWHDALSTIRFDINGRLVDGQHRLLAVVKSDTSQVFSFSFGHDPATAYVVDTGLPRGTNQILTNLIGARNDHGNLVNLPSGTANAFRIYRGLNGSRRSLKGAALVAVWESPAMAVFRENYQQANAFLRDKSARTGATVSTLVAAYVALVNHGRPVSEIEEFFDGLAGVGVASNLDARAKCTGFLLTENTTGGKGQDTALSAMFYAYERWLKGEEVRLFRSQERSPRETLKRIK